MSEGVYECKHPLQAALGLLSAVPLPCQLERDLQAAGAR